MHANPSVFRLTALKLVIEHEKLSLYTWQLSPIANSLRMRGKEGQCFDEAGPLLHEYANAVS